MTIKKAAIILAAGKGKRMKSDLPKVLHKIAGQSMISRVMTTINSLSFDKVIVVIGHQGKLVMDNLKDSNVEFVWQKEQLGTGHAVMMAEDALKEFEGTILVAAGDVPFLSANSINSLLETHRNNHASATCLSALFENPTGYGRIVRLSGTDQMSEIVEEKDAPEEIKKITEINSGTFCFDSIDLFVTLHKIRSDNAQKEYYLTDTVKILQEQQKICAVWTVPDPIEVAGINSKEQLEKLEEEIRTKNN